MRVSGSAIEIEIARAEGAKAVVVVAKESDVRAGSGAQEKVIDERRDEERASDVEFLGSGGEEKESGVERRREEARGIVDVT